MKAVTLYIPCYNAGKTLAACLEAALAQTYPLAGIVVVDDGSTDESAAIMRAYPVRVLRHETNRGLAAARNTVFNNVHTEFVAALDADCVAEPDWLARLMARFDEEGVSGAGGKLVEDRTVSVCDQWRAVHMAQHWEERAGGLEFLFGSNTVFRRQDVLEAGLYNESFRTNYEDVDLSRRLLAVGRRLVYEPAAQARHWKEDDLASLLHSCWKWRQEYYCGQEFYASQDNFALKMKDNVGLSCRYMEEDRAAGRADLIYLDLLLVFHHSLKDLEYFVFRDSDSHGLQKNPRLSLWLALLDLNFFGRYDRKKEKLTSLLYSKEAVSLNMIALILLVDRSVNGRFQKPQFRRLLYKHLLISMCRISDNVLLDKLSGLTGSAMEWGSVLQKAHPHLESNFLILSGMIDQWCGSLFYHSPDIGSLLERSQERVEQELATGREH